jgi:hypothetical protein
MNTTIIPTDDDIIATTKSWLKEAVIGLNLCPFANAVYIKNQIRYVVSQAETPEALAEELAQELTFLQESDPKEIDTTLLIHPYVLSQFLDYNDFLETADGLLQDLDLEGIIQIASFHPDYQFAGTQADDIENYTNRGPYPMLHLLRESSIERAVTLFPDTTVIFEKNIATMQMLGIKAWQQMAFVVSRKQQRLLKK